MLVVRQMNHEYFCSTCMMVEKAMNLVLVRFDGDKVDCRPHLVDKESQGRQCSLGKGLVS